MSRIGKLPIPIPQGVDVQITPTRVAVKGPKGQLALDYHARVTITRENDKILVQRPGDERQQRAYHGLYQRMISNMVQGVTQEFVKNLEIVGVGYKAAMEGQRLVLNVGHSHAVYYDPPEGVTIACPKPNQIILTGIDKQVVGQAAAEVRRFRPPDPYKGKGVRYLGEIIRLKEGKKGTK